MIVEAIRRVVGPASSIALHEPEFSGPEWKYVKECLDSGWVSSAGKIVNRFDGEFPERFADEIFRYLSIPEKEFPVLSKAFAKPALDRNYFMELADKFRSPHRGTQEDGKWRLRQTDWQDAPT